MMNESRTGSKLPSIPFKKASNDILSFSQEGHHYHVLSYGWSECRPVLVLLPLDLEGEFLSGSGEPISLDMTSVDDVNFRISGDPHCVGRWEDGSHVPCPASREPYRGFGQCYECLVQDVPDPACIFEPHCSTRSCGAPFCQVEHVVYITAFRRNFKVGMTQHRRMRTRAMEQGADGMLPLLTLKDRYSARAFEGVISKTMGLPQVVRSHVKLANMVKRRDLGEISRDLMQLKEDLLMLMDDIERRADPAAKISKGPAEFKEGPILIDDYPLEEPLPSRPKMFKKERVIGKVLGYKGNYLLFWQGGTFAFRIVETIGRTLHTSEDLIGL